MLRTPVFRHIVEGGEGLTRRPIAKPVGGQDSARARPRSRPRARRGSSYRPSRRRRWPLTGKSASGHTLHAPPSGKCPGSFGLLRPPRNKFPPTFRGLREVSQVSLVGVGEREERREKKEERKLDPTLLFSSHPQGTLVTLRRNWLLARVSCASVPEKSKKCPDTSRRRRTRAALKYSAVARYPVFFGLLLTFQLPP